MNIKVAKIYTVVQDNKVLTAGTNLMDIYSKIEHLPGVPSYRTINRKLKLENPCVIKDLHIQFIAFN